eukprot:403343473
MEDNDQNKSQQSDQQFNNDSQDYQELDSSQLKQNDISQSASQLSQNLNTHDSRVVKTVRSLKNEQFRRPESAASSKDNNQILKLATNNTQIYVQRHDTTQISMKPQQDFNLNESQLYNENIYSPIKKPITLTGSNSTKENHQNLTQSQGTIIAQNTQTSSQYQRAPIPNAKSQPRNTTSQQRDINIRKNKTHITPGKKGLSSTNVNQNKPQKPQEIQQQLTKQIEDSLIETSKEKVFECVRNSSIIHDILDQAHIDKNEIIDLLYHNKLFRYQLAKLLFGMKMIIKKKVEDFVVTKIQEIIQERQVDEKLMQKFTNVQQKLQNRMYKLQQLSQQYSG